MRLAWQLPDDIVQNNGSRYNYLSNDSPSFTAYERFVTRSELAAQDLARLRDIPKIWEQEGVRDTRFRDDTIRVLPGLFRAMKHAKFSLGLHARAGKESPMHHMPPDLVEKICLAVQSATTAEILACADPHQALVRCGPPQCLISWK
jgi:hypothetical protein